MKKGKHSINPNEIKTRDYNMLSIINGATKSGIHVDKRKQDDKQSCRRWKHSDWRNDD